MNTVVIDTNALLSFVTDRNVEQQVKIASIFEEAAQLRCRLLCPQNVLMEFIYVLEKVYKLRKEHIRNVVSDFIGMPGIHIIDSLDYSVLLNYWPAHFADYGDAIVATVCSAHKQSNVLTFDNKFARSLKRVGMDLFEFRKM